METSNLNERVNEWMRIIQNIFKIEWLQHLLCSKPRVDFISSHKNIFIYSKWWEWRWCIHKHSSHFISFPLSSGALTLNHISSSGRQFCFLFFFFRWLCLAFADIYWSTCISWPNKKTKTMRNTIKLRHKFIHRRMNYRCVLSHSPSFCPLRPFNT